MAEHADRDGNEISVKRWGELRSTPGYVRVDLTILGEIYEVSTVWLGLNHGTDSEPLWFETMVFTSDEEFNNYCRRYETEKEALEGHYEICSMFANLIELTEEGEK